MAVVAPGETPALGSTVISYYLCQVSGVSRFLTYDKYFPFQYANETSYNSIWNHLHTFPAQKTEHCIKPGSKLLFHFVDKLESNVLQRGFWISLFSLHKDWNQI